MSAPTLAPVTVGGWYECTDGTVAEVSWEAGRARTLRTVASWADVPTAADEAARYEAEAAEHAARRDAKAVQL